MRYVFSYFGAAGEEGVITAKKSQKSSLFQQCELSLWDVFAEGNKIRQNQLLEGINAQNIVH